LRASAESIAAAALLAALLSPPGCYRPGAIDCVLACGDDNACPQGMTCSNGFCATAQRTCPAFADVQCEACQSTTHLHSYCRGDVVLRCRQEQGWVEERTCSGDKPVCYHGGCSECRPGTWRCRDGCQEPCNVDGAWARFATCTHCTLPAPRPQLVAGWNHTCALVEGGVVKCWGDNRHRQLGIRDPAGLGLSLPEQVGGLPGDMASLVAVDLGFERTAIELAAGGRHTCARLDNGDVKCWGDNGRGQLGNGDRAGSPLALNKSLRPVDLGTDRTVVGLAAGGRHTCAQLDDGSVKCWGDNSSGQLGLGDTEGRGDDPCEMGVFLPPVDLDGSPAVALAAGFAHTCALLASGDVKCWGDNQYGQLGTGDVQNRGDAEGSPPETLDIEGAVRVTGLALGYGHTCALDAGGRATCWGLNRAGQLGMDSADPLTRAARPGDPRIRIPGPATQIVAGANYTCALIEGGKVKCWGLAVLGQLGLGAPDNQGDSLGEMEALPAVDLGGMGTARATGLAAGGDHTCAILDDGVIKCWGLNRNGQLGIDSVDDHGAQPGQMGDDLPAVLIEAQPDG
jgi:alpha-tubulin suppressor-like RCC1 family protein